MEGCLSIVFLVFLTLQSEFPLISLTAREK